MPSYGLSPWSDVDGLGGVIAMTGNQLTRVIGALFDGSQPC
jgi:hypothetical protein